MKIPDLPSTDSVRSHVELTELFLAVEGRFCTDEELDVYERAMPAMHARAEAARQMRTHEQTIVERVVDEIFREYPFEKQHAHARTKAIRDIRTVAAYACLAMLMDDPRWFRDKLLLWLRTILQAFGFPGKETSGRKLAFASADGEIIQQLKPQQMAIYATYARLKLRFLEVLDAESAALMGPYLQQATDTLAAT